MHSEARAAAGTREAGGIVYSSSFMRKLKKQPLDSLIAEKCKTAGIFRYRGCRGGRHKKKRFAQTRCAKDTNGNKRKEKKVPRLPDLRILLLNARSILNKGPLLAALLSAERASVTAVTETWLRESIPDEVVHAGTYKLFRSDRIGKRGGGVALLLENDWQTFRLECHEHHPGFMECCTVRARKNFMPRETPNIIFHVVYIPPNLNVDQQRQVREHIALSCDKNLQRFPKAKIVLLGDFNSVSVYNACNNFQLRQVVNLPTREQRTLDQIWTDLRIKSVETLPPLGDSDHQVVRATVAHIEKVPGATHSKSIMTRQINDLAINHCGEFLGGTDWSFVTNETDLDRKTAIFSTFLIDTYDHFFPEVPKSVFPNSKPWITKRTLQLMNERRKAFKRGDLQRYRDIHKQVNDQVIKDKSDFYFRNVRNLRKQDPRNWFRMTKTLAGTQPKSTRTIVMDKDTNLDDVNTFFADLGKAPGEDVPPVYPLAMEMDRADRLESYETFRMLNQINTYKGQPFGDVPSFIVKQFSAELARPVTDIFNASITTAKIPTIWSTAEVVPIPKTSAPRSPEEWRPIVKIPILLKVLEKFIAGIFRLAVLSSIAPTQFGGLPKTSTIHYLVSLLHFVHSNINAGKFVCIVTLDVAKAFNSVDLQTLVTLLHECNLRPQIYNWIASLLTSMSQVVRPAGGSVSSGATRVDKGILQGTSLAPTLFLIYINNIPDIPRLWSYLDDLTVAGVGNSVREALEDAQLKLNVLETWYTGRKLRLNASKSKAMVIGNRKVATDTLSPLTIGGQTIPYVSEVKILGVVVHDTLRWTPHVESIISKGNSKLYFFRQLTTLNIDWSSLLLIFKSCIRPLLEYASAAWTPAITKAQIASLERIQKRACYMVTKLWSVPYEDVLKTLNLPSLCEHRDLLNTRLAKSMIKDNRFSELFPPRQGQMSSRTTRNAHKLVTVHFRTERFKKSPIPYLCRLLNDEDPE